MTKGTTKMLMIGGAVLGVYLLTRGRSSVAPAATTTAAPGTTKYDRDVALIDSIRDVVKDTIDKIVGSGGGTSQPDPDIIPQGNGTSGINGHPAPSRMNGHAPMVGMSGLARGGNKFSGGYR